ncbi:MAG TPA: hypothetical protein VI997_00475 [Candidatus Thermoplasmatota archaeon]|nr:hypothetical protein [Candidatus Thermoplasmatota archaeon]
MPSEDAVAKKLEEIRREQKATRETLASTRKKRAEIQRKYKL